jgi:hypothetical protein
VLFRSLKAAGGLAGFAYSVEDAVEIIKSEKPN